MNRQNKAAVAAKACNQPPKPKPENLKSVSWDPHYVPYFVSELAAVSSTEDWKNIKVTTVGKLKEIDAVNKLAILESLWKKDGVFLVLMKTELLPLDFYSIPDNSIVTVFGDIEMTTNDPNKPHIQAKIVRVCDNVHLENYRHSILLSRKRHPNLLK